jgi:hypothetical protein
MADLKSDLSTFWEDWTANHDDTNPTCFLQKTSNGGVIVNKRLWFGTVPWLALFGSKTVLQQPVFRICIDQQKNDIWSALFKQPARPQTLIGLQSVTTDAKVTKVNCPRYFETIDAKHFDSAVFIDPFAGILYHFPQVGEPTTIIYAPPRHELCVDVTVTVRFDKGNVSFWIGDELCVKQVINARVNYVPFVAVLDDVDICVTPV